MLQNKIKYFLYSIICVLVSVANAAGIKEEGVNLLVTIRSAIVAIVAVACGILLLFEGVQGYTGRKTWAEVGGSCLWILFIGAAVAIAAWIFTKGQSVKL